MRRNFRNRKKKHIEDKYLLILMSAFCVLAALVTLTFNISKGPLKFVAGYIFIPMQEGINNAGSFLSGKANDFKTLSEVLKENKELQKEVDELTVELNTNKLEKYELDNYRELLELDEKYPSYEKVAASVVAKDSSNWFSMFTINRGYNDGLAEGMNVIAGKGLVGIVTEVGPNFSKVRSIIDDSNKVSAIVATTEDNFCVNGNLETMNKDNVITFTELKDEDDEVKLGDPIVTSYVSDLYQQGILIGYVSSIEENSNHLTKSGTITPVVDFKHLENVLVILDIKKTSDDYDSDDSKKESTKTTNKKSTNK